MNVSTSRDSSARVLVPSTFTERCSSLSRRNGTDAAACTTASTPSSAARTDEADLRSPCTKRSGVRPLGGVSRSNPVVSIPAAFRLSTNTPPRNPDEPVISTLFDMATTVSRASKRPRCWVSWSYSPLRNSSPCGIYTSGQHNIASSSRPARRADLADACSRTLCQHLIVEPRRCRVRAALPQCGGTINESELA
jgi:hypothetical protein